MAIVGYDSSDEESVHNLALKKTSANQLAHSESSRALVSAIKGDQDHGPSYGPQNPFENKRKRKQLTGVATEEAYSEASFKAQQRSYEMQGYAQSCANDGSYVGNEALAKAGQSNDIEASQFTKHYSKRIKSKRQKRGNAGVFDGEDAYKGPWAKYDKDSETSDSSENEIDTEIPVTISHVDAKATLAAPEERDMDNSESEVETADGDSATETTIFHGATEFDYLHRTYMHVPNDLNVKLTAAAYEGDWYVPKKLKFTWKAHDSVTRIRLFPQSGHLLLSSGNDGIVKLWDVYHERELLRSFHGHRKPVHDIAFSPDGKMFVSASSDKWIKLWNTENGSCVRKWKLDHFPNCVAFNLKQPRFFLVGCSDGRTLQFDVDKDGQDHEYGHHLGPIRTVTFVTDEERFITTSEDKSVRVWDWRVNVPIKFITNVGQQSMVSVALHPDGQHVVAQSKDDQIYLIGANQRFKLNKKKTFTGFHAAGYPIGLTFSPDGHYLISGDAGGNAVFWDYKKIKFLHKLKAHDKACTQVLAHPHESSKLFTAGIDGLIHLWE